MVAVHAAESLSMKGYDACLAVPKVNEKLLYEVRERGVNVIFCPTLPSIFAAEQYWIASFDIILVNVFPMMAAAVEISQFRPVLWWIHEAQDAYSTHYSRTRGVYPKHRDVDRMKNLRIMSVSRVAKQAFEEFYPGRIDGILPLGIPNDERMCAKGNGTHPVTIAILGEIGYLKGQMEFLKAVALLPEHVRKKSRFLVIGRLHADTAYDQGLIAFAEKQPEVRLTGVLTRTELQELYPDIDIITCASFTETVSIAILEGMMAGKVCIVSKNAGIADEVRDGENGFVYETGNVSALSGKLEYVIEHLAELDFVREAARATYQEHFSMQAFGERLEKLPREKVREQCARFPYWYQSIMSRNICGNASTASPRRRSMTSNSSASMMVRPMDAARFWMIMRQKIRDSM